MPGIKVQRRKANENRAAIYALGPEPGRGGQDVHHRADLGDGSPLRTPGTSPSRVTWARDGPRAARVPTDVADARRGLFDTIVCWKSDRLSRGMYPAAALMEVVEAHQSSWTPST